MTNQISPHHHHHHHHHHQQQQQQQQPHHHHGQRRAVDLRIPAIEKYAYCLCLHVKPTTIFIAVFKLIRALLFASMLLNSEISMNDQVNDTAFGPYEERHKSATAAINILGRVIMASVSAVGIYAVISGRAALLMPLYAMLLVDFFFALPAFYNRDLDSSLVDGFGNFRGYPDAASGGGGGGGVPGLGQPPAGLGPASGANTQYARYSLLFIAVSTATMIIRIYFLCVIWKCYRYLRLIELVSPIRLSEIYPHIHANATHPQYPIVRVLSSADSTDSALGPGHNMAPPAYDSIASSMKPPNYEEAMKTNAMTMYPSATGAPQTATTPNNPPLMVPNQPTIVAQQQQQQHSVAVFTDPSSNTAIINPLSTQVISTITNSECRVSQVDRADQSAAQVEPAAAAAITHSSIAGARRRSSSLAPNYSNQARDPTSLPAELVGKLESDYNPDGSTIGANNQTDTSALSRPAASTDNAQSHSALDAANDNNHNNRNNDNNNNAPNGAP